MDYLNLHYIQWLSSSLLKKLGSWGILGVLLSVFSIIFYVSKTPELVTLTETAQSRLEALKTQNEMRPEVKIPSQQNILEEINIFYERFPNAVELPKILSEINNLAEKQKLALNSGDYKFNKLKQTTSLRQHALTKYEIVLPVQGDYPKIRAFIASTLEDIPAIALSDLEITRESTLDANVEAKLVFVLFVKGELW